MSEIDDFIHWLLERTPGLRLHKGILGSWPGFMKHEFVPLPARDIIEGWEEWKTAKAKEGTKEIDKAINDYERRLRDAN